MQVAPPAARVGQGVINKHTLARPHARHKEVSIAATLEVVLLESLFENEITFGVTRGPRLVLHTRIDDRHEFDSLLRELVSERFGIRKTLLIESEHAIAAHVIDVEMHHVERQIAFAILAHDFLNHRVRVVAPATLLITERPQRRQGHVTSQVGVTAENLFDRWSMKEVVIDFAALGAKPRALLRRAAEVEITAVTVIEKDSIRDAALQAEIKRNGLIDRIFAFDVTGRVGVPVNEEAATFVETRGFLTEAVEVFIEAELFRNGHERASLWIEHHSGELALCVVRHRPLVGVDQLVRTRVAKLNQQRRAPHD